MRWDPGHESRDVIDRRGQGMTGGGGGGIGGILMLLPWLLRSRGGRIVAVFLVLGAIASSVFGIGRSPSGTDAARQGVVSGTDEQKHFVSFVLDDVQKTWEQRFAERGGAYRHAKLVLFTGATQTACGAGRAATGPFYCPADERVYIDLAFYDELARRFGARGDFAEAYVVAHEIGHHVQHLLGITDRMSGLRKSEEVGQAGASVRLELQADCFAGIWARSTNERALLEQGDVQEALGAASAVGDDRLQKSATGTVQPETFTHGSAEQRARWFKRGFDQGTLEACDTFQSNVL